jgi:hypothetical protein
MYIYRPFRPILLEMVTNINIVSKTKRLRSNVLSFLSRIYAFYQILTVFHDTYMRYHYHILFDTPRVSPKIFSHENYYEYNNIPSKALKDHFSLKENKSIQR